MREIHNDDIVQCVEYEPQCRTVRIGHKQYYLSFPYMQFTTIVRPMSSFSHKSFHATFSNKPLKSIKSPAFYPLLPNIYPMDDGIIPDLNCQVCLSSDFRRKRCHYTIFEMISNFWQAGFHDRHWKGTQFIRETTLKTYLIWSEKTQEDPTFITKMKWPVKVKIGDFSKLRYETYCCFYERNS